ncbi:MAG: hypothetical protein EBX54_07650 [Betaproteobacteria bacterium]|nr:hypothetical protein [Betaproteobacteria bacterium]
MTAVKAFSACFLVSCLSRRHAGMSRLFRDEEDVKQVIKLKAVYELLEELTDKCKDAAKILEVVVLDHA